MNKIKNLFKKIKSKKMLSIIALLLILVVGSTIAYFNSNTSFANKFNLSAYDVQIEEEFYGTWGTKKVTFANKDTTPVVIRVSYNEMWKSSETEDNKVLYLSNSVKVNDKYIEAAVKDWTGEWSSDFIQGSDGWYYYKKVLDKVDSGKDKVTVLNSVELNDELKASKSYSDYLQAKYELDFNFEAIQASEKAVKEIWNYDILIDNGSVNWPFE